MYERTLLYILIVDKKQWYLIIFLLNHAAFKKRSAVNMFCSEFPIQNVLDNKQQQMLQQHQHQMQKIQQEDQKESERSRAETNVSRENSEERINMMSPLMSKLRFKS